MGGGGLGQWDTSCERTTLQDYTMIWDSNTSAGSIRFLWTEAVMPDLIGRLDLADGEGRLTNAGSPGTCTVDMLQYVGQEFCNLFDNWLGPTSLGWVVRFTGRRRCSDCWRR